MKLLKSPHTLFIRKLEIVIKFAEHNIMLTSFASSYTVCFKVGKISFICRCKKKSLKHTFHTEE